VNALQDLRKKSQGDLLWGEVRVGCSAKFASVDRRLVFLITLKLFKVSKILEKNPR
jgi:hypothetical protein